MEHVFIINPGAGKVDKTIEYSALIHTLCQRKGLDYRIEHSKAPGDITRLAREAAQSGHEVRIYACGGDGTLHEAVNGVAGYPNAAVTCYVCGTGNDFVKIFSQPDAFRSLERLLDAEETSFDLIDCNGTYALNTCCVGLDSRVASDVPMYKRIPGFTGPNAYIASTVVNVIKGTHEHYVIEVEGEVIDGEQTLVCIANGQWYGGSFHAVPDSDPGDGMLDVLIVKRVPLWKLAVVVGQYQVGKYRDYPDLIRHYRTKSITIHCDRETTLNLDGEPLKTVTAHCRVAEHKVRFFYPKGLTYYHEE